MKTSYAIALIALVANQALTPFAFAGDGAPTQAAQGSVQGFVVPSQVYANEPFTFAATGTLQGEVLEVKNVEGTVVAKRNPDVLGRVAMLGIPAGLYLLTKINPSGGRSPSSPLEVLPGNAPSVSDVLDVAPKTPLCNLQEGLNLVGTGINPNAALNKLHSGAMEVPVLAATSRELKTGPIAQLDPGSHDLRLINTASGQSRKLDGLVIYDCMSRLTRTRVGNNEVTEMEFLLRPDNVAGKVEAKIVSGPVNFGGGTMSKMVDVVGGEPKRIPILSNPTGTGAFNVGWTLTTVYLLEGRQAPKKPCPATEHRLEAGAWQRSQEGKKWVAWRRLQCHIHFDCTKQAGHSGDHDFKNKKRCDKREKFTDSNGNGVWDENDGTWTDDGDGKPEAGEYGDANGDGDYDPPEKFEDKNKNGAYDGDTSEKHYFDSKDERDKFIKDNP
jgi:hypothetical protein